MLSLLINRSNHLFQIRATPPLSRRQCSKQNEESSTTECDLAVKQKSSQTIQECEASAQRQPKCLYQHNRLKKQVIINKIFYIKATKFQPMRGASSLRGKPEFLPRVGEEEPPKGSQY